MTSTRYIVGTPTGVREEIAIAAANAGKHVLAEKPFASLRVVATDRRGMPCRTASASWMVITSATTRGRSPSARRWKKQVGWPWSLNSTFQFPLTDRGNIRWNPDSGADGCDRRRRMVLHAGHRRVPATGPRHPIAVDSYVCGAIAAHERRGLPAAGSSSSKTARQAPGTVATTRGAVFTDLRISGANGVITLDDFPNNEPDGSGEYLHYRGGFGDTRAETIAISSEFTSREWMFERFALMTIDDALFEKSVADSERTQSLLDAAWQSALDNEANA